MKYKLSKTKIVTKGIELLPCPFCGSENIKPIHYSGEWGYRPSNDYVICRSCGAIHDRDINAATNILNEGLRILEESA